MKEQTIAALIEENAKREKVFLTEPETGRILTYRQVLSEVREFKKKLESLGFQKGDHAAVALKNSIAAGISILGVMYAGGVVVPVNLGWKEREFTYILEDSKSRFLITQDRILADAGVCIKSHGETDFGDVRLKRLLPKEDRANDGDQKVKESDLALMLYTSGTTGKPKGVMLTHRNLLAETGYVRQGHRLTEEDRGMLVLPLFHINGLVIGFLTPYASGMTLVIPPGFSVSHFWEWIERYEVSWVSAVPTIISMVLSRTPADYPGAKSLRFLRSASAPLPAAVLEEFENRFHIPVIESFGISEGASQITSNPVDGVRKPGSAGVAVGNQLEIADESGKKVPPGVIGEVRIRGDNIFAGYYKKPEETKRV